ncbi:MAG: hypothetical protein WBO10_09350 [Pyrinomonadaceae bacterium]
MSNKTITEFSRFVIFAVTLGMSMAGCAFVSSQPETPSAESKYGPPTVLGTLDSKEIPESSGIAASRCQSNVLWTHNDSGNEPFIFAINLAGKRLGTWKVTNAKNIDWEDIAAYKDSSGKCYLYIGEIGDNKAQRAEHTIYRILEPVVTPSSSASNSKLPLPTDGVESVTFAYPDSDQDAETLLVEPRSGDIYVVTKRVSGPAGVYRVQPDFSSSQTIKAERVAALSVPAIPNGFVTGGDISPDGMHLIICDYTRAYEFDLPAESSFEEVFRQTAVPIDLGQRKLGEAICYSVDGTSLYATSERDDSPLIEVKRRR